MRCDIFGYDRVGIWCGSEVFCENLVIRFVWENKVVKLGCIFVFFMFILSCVLLFFVDYGGFDIIDVVEFLLLRFCKFGVVIVIDFCDCDVICFVVMGDVELIVFVYWDEVDGNWLLVRGEDSLYYFISVVFYMNVVVCFDLDYLKLWFSCVIVFLGFDEYEVFLIDIDKVIELNFDDVDMFIYCVRVYFGFK